MLVKTILTIAAGLSCASLLTTAAAAQTAPAEPTPSPQQQPLPQQPFAPQWMNPQEQIWRQSLTDTAMTAPTKTQWARARRAAELVNANRCAEAFALARTEKDQRLETGVSKVCLARKT
jgi:hypothetical protein